MLKIFEIPEAVLYFELNFEGLASRNLTTPVLCTGMSTQTGQYYPTQRQSLTLFIPNILKDNPQMLHLIIIDFQLCFLYHITKSAY